VTLLFTGEIIGITEELLAIRPESAVSARNSSRLPLRNGKYVLICLVPVFGFLGLLGSTRGDLYFPVFILGG
jgi:hypothetical protein